MKRMTTNSLSSSWISPEEFLSLRTSLVKTYLRCPAQCLFRYFKGLVVLPKSFITMGTCTHVTAEHANKYKKAKGKEEKVSTLQDVFHESWKEKSKNTQFTKEEKPADLEHEGVKKLIPTYHEKIYKRVEPLYVEESFKLDIDDHLRITGTLDLVETDNMIRDLKTKGRSPQWDEAIKSFQGKSYRSGFKAKFGKAPEGFILDCLVRTQEPKVVTTKPVAYKDSDHLEFIETCKQVASCIRQGIFYPKREGNYFCSPTSCGYWGICTKGEWRKLVPYTQIYGGNQAKEEETAE